MCVCIAPLISHQKHTVCRFTNQPIIFSGIKKPLLVIGSLRGQGSGYMVAIWGKKISGFRYEICKGDSVLGKNKFKINIYPLESFFRQGHQKVIQQVCLYFFIIYQRSNQIVVKITVRTKRSQSEDGTHTGFQRGADHETIVNSRGHQTAVGGEAIGKDGQGSEKGQRIFQNILCNKGVGVAVYIGRIRRDGRGAGR